MPITFWKLIYDILNPYVYNNYHSENVFIVLLSFKKI